jgi:heme-degrading monooxygenase HmoA
VALFRRSPGYLKTELYRDLDDLHRYVTVDTWESREAHDEFRRRFAAEFAELDAACEALTLREVRFGHFSAQGAKPVR